MSAPGVVAIDSDVERDGFWLPRAELLAEEDAGRIVLNSLSNDHFRATRDEVKHPANGVGRSLVGRVLVAFSHPLGRVQGSGFRGAHQVKLDDALQVRYQFGLESCHKNLN